MRTFLVAAVVLLAQQAPVPRQPLVRIGLIQDAPTVSLRSTRVGMCQVGAYGMAMDGATYEEILKKYYKGIELTKIY